MLNVAAWSRSLWLNFALKGRKKGWLFKGRAFWKCGAPVDFLGREESFDFTIRHSFATKLRGQDKAVANESDAISFCPGQSCHWKNFFVEKVPKPKRLATDNKAFSVRRSLWLLWPLIIEQSGQSGLNAGCRELKKLLKLLSLLTQAAGFKWH